MKEELDIERPKRSFLKTNWFRLLSVVVFLVILIYGITGWNKYYDLNSKILTQKGDNIQDSIKYLQREIVAIRASNDALYREYDSVCNVLKIDSVEMKKKDEYYDKIYDSINSIPIDRLIELCPITD